MARIAVGYDGSLWGLNSQGLIYQYAPGQGWNQISGNLAQIVVGSASNVWGVNSGGATYHYVNGSFQYAPGTLVQVAVGSDGDAWGLNSASSIYHFNGIGWSQIPGNLVQIAVGSASTVYGVNSAGNIYHFNTSTQTFQQFTTGLATQISVGQDGMSGGQVYQYVSGSWNALPELLAWFRQATSLGSARVIHALERVAETRGLPSTIRVDNGPEFSSRQFRAWCEQKGVAIVYIQPGRPTQNAIVESFHARLRDECLNANWFWNLADARMKITLWREHYNHSRPHSSLGYLTPAEFRAGHPLPPGRPAVISQTQ